jgi:hypothetical protein
MIVPRDDAPKGTCSDFEFFHRQGATDAKETPTIASFSLRSLRLCGEF